MAQVTTRNVRIGTTWPEIVSRFVLAWAVIRAGLLTSNYEYLLLRFIETLPTMGTWVHGYCNLQWPNLQNTSI